MSETNSISFQLKSFGWQCSFHPTDPYLLFAGTAQNDLYKFDIRNPTNPVTMYTIQHTRGKGIHSVYLDNS